MPDHPAPVASGKCVGFVERIETSAREQQEARRNRPQPWFARKLMVGVVIAILIYTYYVYVGRFCADMIKRNSSAKGSRPQGSGCFSVVESDAIGPNLASHSVVAFLVIFNCLFLLTCWSYVRIVLTPPGYARDVRTITAFSYRASLVVDDLQSAHRAYSFPVCPA